MFGLLGSAAVLNNKVLSRYPAGYFISIVVFMIGQVITGLSIFFQPRFDLGLINEILGGVFLLLALVFLSPSLSLKAIAGEERQLQTKGLFGVVRHPIYFGQVLFALGMNLINASWIGLSFVPIWFIAFSILASVEEGLLVRSMGRAYLVYRNQVKGKIFPSLTRSSEADLYPYKNLVFKGGGVRGIAYIGALEVLAQRGILTRIQRVAGTSAGAITAAIVSLNLSLEETIAVANSLDYTKVPMVRKEGEMEWVPGVIEGANRMVRNFGWFSSDYFYGWMKNVIAEYCNGNGMATFADFKASGFKDLYIVVSNITRRNAQVMSYENTPNIAVADAVRMSMSIPLYFEALRFNGLAFGNGDLYADGGLFDNYPVHIFDDERFSKDNDWYQGGINWETLGCYLFPLERKFIANDQRQGLLGYIEVLMDNLASSHELSHIETNLIDQRRTIMIGDCGIETTDFDIKPGDEKFKALVHSGAVSTQSYLERDRLLVV
jgi:NTE family protein